MYYTVHTTNALISNPASKGIVHCFALFEQFAMVEGDRCRSNPLRTIFKRLKSGDIVQQTNIDCAPTWGGGGASSSCFKCRLLKSPFRKCLDRETSRDLKNLMNFIPIPTRCAAVSVTLSSTH
jgi:hypothetical protein